MFSRLYSVEVLFFENIDDHGPDTVTSSVIYVIANSLREAIELGEQYAEQSKGSGFYELSGSEQVLEVFTGKEYEKEEVVVLKQGSQMGWEYVGEERSI